ncbi:MAG TPA: cytochrome c family protein [Sphingomonas sp.]|nr:cytochrome c family protein [Sphingomonas sp.]
MVKTFWLKIGLNLILIAGAAASAEAAPSANVAHGQQIFARCAGCHTIGRTGGGTMGPTLNGVVGRKAASVPGFQYSASMRNSGFTWDTPTLGKFLQAPMKAVPGTKMFFAGIPAPQDQADLIAFLKQYKADGSKK